MCAVIAESYERIHRSSLIGIGVLPLPFTDGESAHSIGLSGEECVEIAGVESLNDGLPRTAHVRAGATDFDATVRIDTPGEADCDRHGSILQFALCRLLAGSPEAHDT